MNSICFDCRKYFAPVQVMYKACTGFVKVFLCAYQIKWL
jgi:hypothetical protein